MARVFPATPRLILWLPALVSAVFFVTGERIRAQTVLNSANALDVPTDAQSIAMGESFTGVPAYLPAIIYNPAGLAGISGVQASYSYRSQHWLSFLSELDYHSAALAFSIPLFAVGIFYTRSDLGSADVIDRNTLAVIGQVESHSDMLAIGFGRSFTPQLSCGITVKGYSEEETTTGGNPGLSYQSYGSFMVDIGALYTVSGLMGDARFRDIYSAGISLQNFGSDLREQISLYDAPPSPSVLIRIPRYLRFGISCSLDILPAEQGGFVPVRIVATGAYRNLLNPSAYQAGDRDVWGWGLEVSAYELVTLRMGASINGVSSLFGPKGSPMLRYGAGITVPLPRFGASVPLTVRFDYAAIPVQHMYLYNPAESKTVLPALTVSAEYAMNVL